MNLRLLVILSALIVSACGGNSRSIYRTVDTVVAVPGDPVVQTQSIVVDAKQRMIITVPPRRDDPEQIAITCAEPSPDALAAVSAALSGSASYSLIGIGQSDTKAALSGAVQEAAKQINRNNVVQLLRDGLYRACEAYMNGAMSREEYASMARRYADITVSLVALEQMGGVRGPRSEGTVGPVATSNARITNTDGENPETDVTAEAGGDQTGTHVDPIAGSGPEVTRAPYWAKAMADVIDRYYDASVGPDGDQHLQTNHNYMSLLSRCMGYFDRSPAAVGEDITSEFYVRKGVTVFMCAGLMPPEIQKLITSDPELIGELVGSMGSLVATGAGLEEEALRRNFENSLRKRQAD